MEQSSRLGHKLILIRYNKSLLTKTTIQMNLFNYLFKLIMRGQIKAYEYTLDMNPHFTDDKVIKAKKIMDDHQIFYESKDGKIRVNDADLPSEEVKYRRRIES